MFNFNQSFPKSLGLAPVAALTFLLSSSSIYAMVDDIEQATRVVITNNNLLDLTIPKRLARNRVVKSIKINYSLSEFTADRDADWALFNLKDIVRTGLCNKENLEEFEISTFSVPIFFLRMDVAGVFQDFDHQRSLQKRNLSPEYYLNLPHLRFLKTLQKLKVGRIEAFNGDEMYLGALFSGTSLRLKEFQLGNELTTWDLEDQPLPQDQYQALPPQGRYQPLPSQVRPFQPQPPRYEPLPSQGQYQPYQPQPQYQPLPSQGRPFQPQPPRYEPLPSQGQYQPQPQYQPLPSQGQYQPLPSQYRPQYHPLPPQNQIDPVVSEMRRSYLARNVIPLPTVIQAYRFYNADRLAGAPKSGLKTEEAVVKFIIEGNSPYKFGELTPADQQAVVHLFRAVS